MAALSFTSRQVFRLVYVIISNAEQAKQLKRMTQGSLNHLIIHHFLIGLTQLADAGHFTGVKGQFKVGLCPLG